jgi:hypothetical protein
LLDWATMDAPLCHVDVGSSSSVANTAAATATDWEPSFVGTAVLRIFVRAALECETRSRAVAPNRTHICISLTNVSPMNTQVQLVEFDLLSTRIGQFKDSLDYVANKSPDYRTAPKAPEDDLVNLLTRSISVVPLPVDERKPYLQPRETYCFQFVVQLRPHLAHLLTSLASATSPTSSNGRSAMPTEVGVQHSSLESVNVTQQLRGILRKTFVSAVHVQFLSDAWEDRSVVFRAEQSVLWTLS